MPAMGQDTKREKRIRKGSRRRRRRRRRRKRRKGTWMLVGIESCFVAYFFVVITFNVLLNGATEREQQEGNLADME